MPLHQKINAKKEGYIMEVIQEPDIKDIARWFLSKEAMTQKKLQKLCYYAVAWGWALMDREIATDSEFQAWIHGPVSPTLYAEYKNYGWNNIPKEGQMPIFLSDIKELLESVWDTYGDKGGNELEAISHRERPWLEARGGIDEFELSTKAIDTKLMREFYLSIYQK